MAEKDKSAATSEKQELHPRAERAAGIIRIKDRELVDFTNWDLFDLNSNPAFIKAAQKEIERSGLGAASVRTSSGTTPAHISCERRLAKFFGAEKALLYPSKDHAFFSVIAEFLNKHDTVFFDEQIKIPIEQACALSKIPAHKFNPVNLSTLEQALKSASAAKRRFVIIEHVSPVAGRKQDFPAILELLDRYDAELIVDESYALGIEGVRGAGVSEIAGIREKTALFAGDLSAIIPSFGAFVAGKAAPLEVIVKNSKEFSEDTALPPALAAASEAALDILELAHSSREKLQAYAMRLREGLARAGFLDANDSKSPIVSVAVGTPRKAEEFSFALFQRGFFADTVMLSTPYSEIGFARFLVGVFHTPKMLDDLMQTVSDVYSRLPPD